MEKDADPSVHRHEKCLVEKDLFGIITRDFSKKRMDSLQSHAVSEPWLARISSTN